MPTDSLGALALFAFSTSITPGPNNLFLLASGLNFGFKRSLPHMLGVNAGFAALLLCVGLGLGELLGARPWLQQGLQGVFAAYLLYLAWGLVRALPAQGPAASPPRPWSFVQAFIFQSVNPKAWFMALGVVSAYLPSAYGHGDLGRAVLVFSLVNAPCISLWVFAGRGMTGILSSPRRVRLMNYFLAGLLVASMVWAWATKL